MLGEFFSNLFWALLMLVHMVAPVLLIILAVTLAAGIWSRFFKKNDIPDSGSILILKERYARGEITKEEFFRSKEELTRV